MNEFTPNPQPHKSRWWIWLLLVLVLAGGAVAWFLFSSRDVQTEKQTQEQTQVQDQAQQSEITAYRVNEPLVFENDQCAFYIDEIGEKGGYLELDVRCVNKTADTLRFSWEAVSISDIMFDPLWEVTAQKLSTVESSITFPLNSLEEHGLLPAQKIGYILSIYNVEAYTRQIVQANEHRPIYEEEYNLVSDEVWNDTKVINGYDGMRFPKSVQADNAGRLYFSGENGQRIYFDEIYDFNGVPSFRFKKEVSYTAGFYHDSFGRPYYFSDDGDTVYYDGFGFAFHDNESGLNYYFDMNGDPAYYGNGGNPVPYEGSADDPNLSTEKPADLLKAEGQHIVHREFTVYPTGKEPTGSVMPARITTKNEQFYWAGEKGSFCILGGESDAFKGYIIYTCVENNSDNYIFFSWGDTAIVNGELVFPSTTTVLRPHSRCYRNIVITLDELKSHKLKPQDVAEVDFRVYAKGENLSVPLYPIEWEVPGKIVLK